MKKYLSLILVAIVLVMALALVSCKNEEPPAPAPDNGEHVHTPGEWVLVKAPTCVDEGEQLQFCTSCKMLLHRMPVYDDWNHVEVVTIERQEPTCNKVGYTAETRCSVCDAVVSHRTEIPALGHTAGEWMTVKAPDCLNEGDKEKHCIRCDVLMENGTVAPLGHTPGEWETTLEPTCEGAGTKIKKCTVCEAEVDTETITALGHVYNTWVWVEDGIERLDCGVCGHEGAEKAFSKGLAYELYGESYRVKGVGSCTDVDIVLPHVYEGKFVTEISQSAFADCENIKSVYIPNTVNRIYRYAFSLCVKMESVKFEENSQLHTIDQQAFQKCKSLKSIEIPASVINIGKEAFVGSGLVSVTFGNPDGWWYASTSLVSSGTSLSAVDLSDSAKAAQYLVEDYVGKWWKK